MKVAEIIQMLHNASLMIDDIEDGSILRRGLPVAHSIYGVPSTINSANYVYFLALQKTAAFGSAEAMRMFTEELLELHRGQGMELHWRDTVCCPTEDQYLKMVARKTGGLFNLAVRLMKLFSQNQTDFQPLVESLGIYFQIRDDFANLWASEYADAKSYCEDLTEGKFSFPIIHAIRSRPNDSRVLYIVRQKPNEVEVKRYCVGLLEEFGSYDYTKTRLIELEAKIRQQINDHGGNPYLGPILDELKKIYTV